jgi:hypothetical protein
MKKHLKGLGQALILFLTRLINRSHKHGPYFGSAKVMFQNGKTLSFLSIYAEKDI